MTVITAPFGTHKTPSGATVPNTKAQKPQKPGDKYNPNRPLDFQGGTTAAYRAAQAALSAGKQTKGKPTKTVAKKTKSTPGAPSAPSIPQTPGTPTTPLQAPNANPITGSVEDAAIADVNNPGYGAVGNGGTNLAGQFNPGNYAKGMAGMQYDPAILQVANRIKGIINALPGSLDSLHKAFANLDARAAAPPVETPVGSGSAASNAYAAQLANLDNVQASSQAHAAASREADWGERIKLLSGANVNDMRGQLTGLTQAKGDAQVGYYNQGIKTKSDLVSQAISNINAIRASNDAQAMVGGQLTNLGLKNDALSLANSGTAISNAYAPLGYQQNLTQGNQTIQSNDVAIKAAKNTLTQTLAAQPGTTKNLKNALAGGPQANAALTSLIIPTTGITQNPTTGYSHVMGDPNTWVKNGVAQIMRTLPKSNRSNVTKYVNDVISQAVSSAGGWTQNKNGKWIRPK